MASKGGNDGFLMDHNPFSFVIPKTIVLLALLMAMSIIIGTASIALINHNLINTRFQYILVNGATTGILSIMLPTLLTVMIIKAIRRHVEARYITFIAMIGAICYSMFILLGGIAYILSGSYTLATAIIVLGDASIFGWWFFATKMVFGPKRRTLLLAVVQSTLNIILYIPSSRLINSIAEPLNVLLLKLYAGIFIFMIISYAIIYIVDRPYRKNFGFHGFDAVAQMLQNWLFDANISTPFGVKFGTPTDVRTDTIVFRRKGGDIKSIFFIPEIHYGPAGTLAGSDFPHLLEHYASQKYKAQAMIMHSTVDMDQNPISSSQFGQLRDALDKGVASSSRKGRAQYTFSSGSHESASITRLGLGDVSLVTMTRAPRVTEDVPLDTSILLKEMLDVRFGPSVLVDAHNSRYETAPKAELDGVKLNSRAMKEYVAAIKSVGKPSHRGSALRMGVASMDAEQRLGKTIDIAKGNVNVAVLQMNGMKHAIIQFNANNAMPNLRAAMLRSIRKKYKISAELYTTDTHAVNSPEYNASNVLGRYTDHRKLISLAEDLVAIALSNMEQVTVHHGRIDMKRFKIWGPNSMESIITVARSTYGITRILVPMIIAIGFIIAAWVILII